MVHLLSVQIDYTHIYGHYIGSIFYKKPKNLKIKPLALLLTEIHNIDCL